MLTEAHIHAAHWLTDRKRPQLRDLAWLDFLDSSRRYTDEWQDEYERRMLLRSINAAEARPSELLRPAKSTLDIAPDLLLRSADLL